MKFCLVSTSIRNTTGYSKVAYNLLKELVKVSGLDVYHFAFQYHPSNFSIRRAIKGVTTEEHQDFEYKRLRSFCEKHDFDEDDVVMIYNDIGVVLNYVKSWKPPRLWVYLDTVLEGIPPPVLKHLEDTAERIYLFAPHWAKYYDFPQAKVLEHGVDTEVFKPVETDGLRLKLNLPDEAIVYLNANRNSRRKRFDLTISGFIQFAKRHPELPLYLLLLTANEHAGYYDFQSIIFHECKKHNYADVSKRIMIVDTSKIVMGDDGVNEFYALADVGVNTSTGEGYGLTALEHASLGKPQVLTHLPQYDDFMPSNAVAYAEDIGEREYTDKVDYFGAFQPTFLSKDVADAMDKALELRGKVSFTPRSWSTIVEPLLDDIKNLKHDTSSVSKDHHS